LNIFVGKLFNKTHVAIRKIFRHLDFNKPRLEMSRIRNVQELVPIIPSNPKFEQDNSSLLARFEFYCINVICDYKIMLKYAHSNRYCAIKS
jgi:hypothetical protein